MAFGAEAIAEYEFYAQFREGQIEEDNSKKDFAVELLIFKEQEWDSKIADKMLEKTCEDMQNLAYLKNSAPVSKQQNSNAPQKI